jgi:flagellar motor switch protein FliG
VVALARSDVVPPEMNDALKAVGFKKAAVILLALGGSTSSTIIKSFELSEIKRFAVTAAQLDEIDTDYLVNVVDELSEEMNREEPLTGGDQKARALLDEALPLDRVKAVYSNDDGYALNIWKKFTLDNESQITPYLLDEHPQTITFIVSNISHDVAPRIISMLPRDLRNTVIHRLLKVSPIQTEFNQILQRNLQNDLLLKDATSSALEGIDRIARLLNKMDKPNVDSILEGLGIISPVEAAAIKKLLFSFEDIIRLSQKDRLIMFDKIQTEQVMLALRGSSSELREAILSAQGARARRMIEAELAEASGELTKDVLEARQAIAEVAIKLGASGLIRLAEPDDLVNTIVKSEEVA